MKLPLLSELEPEQMDVYLHSAFKSLVVIGPPGSGKTSLAIWRALFATDQGQTVMLLTKNRTLSALAGQLSKEGQGGSFETSTMHSYVWNDYKDRFGKPPTEGIRDYNLRWPELLTTYAKAGVKPFVDHLMVDEGQNLPAEFFTWAQKHCAKTLSVFADEHQTTAEDGSTMADLEELNVEDWFRLVFNHRNTERIAALSGYFHAARKLPAATPRRGAVGEVPRLVSISGWQNVVTMVSNRLANQAGSIGVITYRQKHVKEIYEALRAALPKRRVDSYHSLMDRGAEFIKMRDDGVTVISGESAIGLEFDAVYLHDLGRSLPITEEMDRRRLYMLTARARDLLVLLNGPAKLDAAQLADLPPKPYLER